jgi:hypothetical protein
MLNAFLDDHEHPSSQPWKDAILRALAVALESLEHPRATLLSPCRKCRITLSHAFEVNDGPNVMNNA